SILELRFCHRFVDEIRERRSDHHHYAHNEQPHQKLNLNGLIVRSDELLVDCKNDKRDESDPGHAVGFESVRAGAYRISRVVAGAIGDNTGIARVVFLDLELDLHQVRADISNLGEYAARYPQRCRAERFANRKSDEAWPGIRAGNKQKDAEHDQQLNADQHHADAHSSFERDRIERIWFALKTGKRRSGVCKGIDPDAKPGNSIAAGDANEAEKQN